jgi:hypothetical protein
VVLKVWVTDTKLTLWASKVSTMRAKSASERVSRLCQIKIRCPAGQAG